MKLVKVYVLVAQVKITPYPINNFNERPAAIKIDTIVIHSMYAAGNDYPHSTIACFNSLIENEVSSHFSIARDGTIYQHVELSKRAWHAGKSKMSDGRENVNDFSIGIELIGVLGQRFRASQYRSLNQLLLKLSKEFPIYTIIGHQTIAPDRKVDPGPSFRWDKVKRGLRKAGVNLKVIY